VETRDGQAGSGALRRRPFAGQRAPPGRGELNVSSRAALTNRLLYAGRKMEKARSRFAKAVDIDLRQE